MSPNAFDDVWGRLVDECDCATFVNEHLKERGEFVDILRKWLGGVKSDKPAKVLEAGCGTAIDSYALARPITSSDLMVKISCKV